MATIPFSQPLSFVTIQNLHDWRLATDPENIGRDARWYDRLPEDAVPVPVPGVIEQVAPGYHGVAWYFCAIPPVRPATAEERVLLRFGAVDYLAEVWLNGQPVGGHEGGETPFTLDVTSAMRPGENLLAVRVLNPTDTPIDGIVLAETPHRNKVMQFMPGSSFNYGGIMLPVELQIVPAVRIVDMLATPDIAGECLHVQVWTVNATGAPWQGRLLVTAGPDRTGEVTAAETATQTLTGEDSCFILTVPMPQPRLWDLGDPFLYRVTAVLEATREGKPALAHQQSVRCGFRDFRVERGFFRLNGRRVFLRSTHTGNHFPIGQVVPQDPDFMRRDLLFAKVSGFNMVRFIAGMAWPEQLDYCDEIGLMVYEENLAGWCLADSPQMNRRFKRSVCEMVRRDRNHPSVTIWGLLNETPDGPVFRAAVESLPLVRALDTSRLVLLSSGRWDGHPEIGSVSNPGGEVWEPAWGVEGPEPPAVDSSLGWHPGGYLDRAGDAHIYPQTPQTREMSKFIRHLGAGTQPVFLSEYGIGSLMNIVGELREFEQVNARADLTDMAVIRAMVERLDTDWQRLGFDGVYPFVEDMLLDSQRLHARQRLIGFDCIRANPQICGFNLTGILDHAITGEGLWSFWRHWKPDTFTAVTDGWAPLRWCLFATPMHGYAGRPMTLEAVLATEDVLAPGDYPVHLRVLGPACVAWERETLLTIPAPVPGADGPLALPVLREEVTLTGPAGTYTFAVTLLRGGAPQGGRLTFYLSDPADLPAGTGDVAGWGIDEPTVCWLSAHGITCRPLSDATPANSLILVGDPGGAAEDAATWQALTTRIHAGATAVFLSPRVFRRGDDPVHWLPLANQGQYVEFHDWLYHKECVAKDHPIFAGLQRRGVLDWDYYDQVIPHSFFNGQDTPDDTAAAAFAAGYCCPGGYACGTLVSTHRLGAGRIVLNTLHILEHLDQHPAADRLLLNLIRYAAGVG